MYPDFIDLNKISQLKKDGRLIPPPEMIKTKEQIAGIKEASTLNTMLLDYLEPHVKAGVSTLEIDNLTLEFTSSHNAVCADFGYMGYPKHICTSVNDVVCHGIPSADVVLQDGDIINIDATTMYNDYYGDASRTFVIGKVHPLIQDLVDHTKEALEKAIGAIVPYETTIGDIGEMIENYALEHDLSVVKEFTGHGVGLALHEEPYVYHFKPNEKTYTIIPGMVFTIEPMLNLGGEEIFIDEDDQWTVYTEDGYPSCQFEHTILITPEGVEILSK